MDAKAEKIALFRFGLVASLVLEPLPRGELARRAEEIASRHYEIPYSQRISVSVDTLLAWAIRYRKGGLEALGPKSRKDRGRSRAISPPLADLIERLKRENPHRTGATLLRELALSSDQNSPPLSAATLFREGLARLGVAPLGFGHVVPWVVGEAGAGKSRLIAALYGALEDFPVFVELSKLYFAAAAFSEAARRHGRPELAGTFLCGGHEEFGNCPLPDQ